MRVLCYLLILLTFAPATNAALCSPALALPPSSDSFCFQQISAVRLNIFVANKLIILTFQRGATNTLAMRSAEFILL